MNIDDNLISSQVEQFEQDYDKIFHRLNQFINDDKKSKSSTTKTSWMNKSSLVAFFLPMLLLIYVFTLAINSIQ